MSKIRALRALSRHDRKLEKLGQAVELFAPGRFDPEAWLVMAPQLDELGAAVELVQRRGLDDFPSWAKAADSWPADNFYAVLWQYTRPGQDEAIAKWLEAANGDPTVYTIGRRSWSPGWFAPTWDPYGKGGDCTGFGAFGLDREKNGGDDWQNAKVQDLWFHTDSVWTDATGPQVMFRKLDGPEPGCLGVYPDRPKSEGGGQGHFVVILEVNAGGKLVGIDCSSRQSKKGDAIRVRDMTWTRRKIDSRRLVYCKPVWWG